MRRTLSHLTLGLVTTIAATGCYNVQLVSPDDKPVQLGKAGDGCAEVMHDRSHFLLWGLANLDEPVKLPGGRTVRVEVERDFVDGLLGFIGLALTAGIYGGSVSTLAYDCR